MSVINKRNAVFGWLAWKVVKQAAKQKAKLETRADDGRRRGKLVAPAAIAAAVGGAVFVWRRLQGGDDDETT
jgi:hypothetical protein